tara:strand:+ start:2861 stop:3481 length:621 start_codon:yes stop_codon:yes gene_type:complete
MGDLTYQQILEMLKGQYAGMDRSGVMDGSVGSRGFDTPAKREELAFDSDNGVMDLATNYKNTNATQADYDTKMSYIDSAPALGGLDKMRALQNIDSSNLGFLSDSELGAGDRGFDTPAAREGAIAELEFLENSFAGTGMPNLDAGVVDPEKFNNQYNNLTIREKSNVDEIMANMTEDEKRTFALGITGAPLSGFQVQDEAYDYWTR